MIFITPFADLWRTSASPSIIFSFERTGTVWSGHRNRFLKAWIILHIFAESRLNRTQNRSALFGNKTCGLLAGSRTQGKTAVEGIADLQFEFSSHSV